MKDNYRDEQLIDIQWNDNRWEDGLPKSIIDFGEEWGKAAGLSPMETAKRIFDLIMSPISFEEQIETMNKWAEEAGITGRIEIDLDID